MRIFKEFIILIIAAASVIYLFLPSLLPDVVPLIGWLDEGLATTIVLSALKHWGFDLTGLFGDNQKVEQIPAKQSEEYIVVNSETTGQKTRKVRIPREVLERALQDYQQEQYSGR